MGQDHTLEQQFSAAGTVGILTDDAILQSTKTINDMCDVPTCPVAVKKEETVERTLFIKTVRRLGRCLRRRDALTYTAPEILSPLHDGHAFGIFLFLVPHQIYKKNTQNMNSL